MDNFYTSHYTLNRYVELYGEGFGYTDHIRWDEGIDLSNSGVSEVYYQKWLQTRQAIHQR